MRRARDHLTALGSRAEATGCPLPRLAVRTVLVRFDARGHLRACSAQALGLLLRCHEDPLQNRGRWTTSDVTVLPQPLQDRVRGMLRDAQSPGDAEMELSHATGLLELRAKRLINDDFSPEVLVAISQMEPMDLAVARLIHDWRLAPIEKELAVALTRGPSQRELAEQMGCTLGTMKGYLNNLYAKMGVDSREALMALITNKRNAPAAER